jgi:hypothetical protein
MIRSNRIGVSFIALAIIFCFSHCFIQYSGKTQNYIEKAAYFCSKKNYEKAFNVVISHLKRDSSYSISLKLNAIYLDRRLDSLTLNKKYDESIKNCIVSRYVNYYPFPDPDKILPFINLYIADQKIRSTCGWIKDNYPNKVDSIRKLRTEMDAITLKNALIITEGYTADSFVALGKFPINCFYYVIIHSGIHYQEKHFSLFQEMARLNYIGPFQLATMEDKMLINQEKPQKYGTQLCNPVSTNYYYPHPFVSIDSLNYYRKSIGIGTRNIIDEWKDLGINVDSLLLALPLK